MRTRVIPMSTGGIQHFVNRIYREGGTFQWVRETAVNALEANATRIHYGVEWQAVERLGVYRRLIADDGDGMAPEQLEAFFNRLGSGGKPIGGADENFGVGAKTSLLPWNPCGVVVISWVDGVAAMIWLQLDQGTGEYGLHCFQATDAEGQVSLVTVVTPFWDAEHGCDWRRVKPNWIDKHGTVIVLLGSTATADTILGDPGRAEASVHGIVKYLNNRFWELPHSLTIDSTVFQFEEKARWPNASGGNPSSDRSFSVRQARGAKHWITEKTGATGGALAATGTVALEDGTTAHWYLWGGERPQVHGYASEFGYTAVLYKNELYSNNAHHAHYRSLGIGIASVRKRLWVIFEPAPLTEGTRRGIFPTTDRNALRIADGSTGGDELPIGDWVSEFAERMPPEIQKALADARGDEPSTLDDEKWLKRLIDKFEARWRMPRLRSAPSGAESVLPSAPGVPARESGDRTEGKVSGHGETKLPSPTPNSMEDGRGPGPAPAKASMQRGSLPYCEVRPSEDFEDPAYLAVWQPKDPRYRSGIILLNRDHPILKQQLDFYRLCFAEVDPIAVEREVLTAYKEVVIAKVAHSEHLRALLPSAIIDTEMRSPAGLTMALIGLIAEDSLIGTRIGQLLKRRRAS
jgi:hypothetical protein